MTISHNLRQDQLDARRLFNAKTAITNCARFYQTVSLHDTLKLTATRAIENHLRR